MTGKFVYHGELIWHRSQLPGRIDARRSRNGELARRSGERYRVTFEIVYPSRKRTRATGGHGGRQGGGRKATGAVESERIAIAIESGLVREAPARYATASASNPAIKRRRSRLRGDKYRSFRGTGPRVRETYGWTEIMRGDSAKVDGGGDIRGDEERPLPAPLSNANLPLRPRGRRPLYLASSPTERNPPRFQDSPPLYLSTTSVPRF